MLLRKYVWIRGRWAEEKRMARKGRKQCKRRGEGKETWEMKCWSRSKRWGKSLFFFALEGFKQVNRAPLLHLCMSVKDRMDCKYFWICLWCSCRCSCAMLHNLVSLWVHSHKPILCGQGKTLKARFSLQYSPDSSPFFIPFVPLSLSLCASFSLPSLLRIPQFSLGDSLAAGGYSECFFFLHTSLINLSPSPILSS